MILSTIALSHYNVTIKTFIKILLFNARDHDGLEETKEHKFTVKRSTTVYKFKKKSEIISKSLIVFSTYEHTAHYI